MTDTSFFDGGERALPGVRRDGYVWPAYDDYSFDRVPGTAARALGVDLDRALPPATVPDGDYERVVVLLVDGYGWDRFQAGERPSLLSRAATAGETTAITSVYPSETAAAITSLNTGRTPAEHGLLGWNLRLPTVDRTVQTLPFVTRPADDRRAAAAAAGEDPTVPELSPTDDPRDLTAATDGAVDGENLFDGRSVYERLGEAGVESHAIQPSRITGGPYGAQALAGATVHGVDSVAEFGLSIRRRLTAATQPTYVYAYWPAVDGAAHDAGTRSDEYAAELAAVCGAVERELDRLPDATAEETLLLVTADHGHRQSDPSAAVDLTTLPDVWGSLARHDDGRPVLPTGGPRNLHLHLQPGTEETVRAALSGADFEARVLSGERAVEAGLFGDGPVSPKLRERVGDLVVVPKSVGVWIDDERRKLEFVGQHGGQHPEEMSVPFLAAPVGSW